MPVITCADEVPVISISEKTNPKIAELYQQLQSVQDKVNQIQSEHVDKLSENYQAVKENEQRTENRLLTAGTTAVTGVGGMELAQGWAERNADKDAEEDMAKYLATVKCTYGNGQLVKFGSDPVELPSGDYENLNKYKALAGKLKERKELLGMMPGIESEVILDKSDMGLYDDENVGITDDGYGSVYRAMAKNSEEDQTKLDEDAKKSKTRMYAGGAAAAVGVIGSSILNAKINKDAPKNESDKINQEYDEQLAKTTKDQENLTNQLNQAIAENAKQVKEYNSKLADYKEKVSNIQKKLKSAPTACKELFNIPEVDDLQPIENETDDVPNIEFANTAELQNLLEQCTQCNNGGGTFDSETEKCSYPPKETVTTDVKSVEQTTIVDTHIATTNFDATEKDIETIMNALRATVQTLTEEQKAP